VTFLHRDGGRPTASTPISFGPGPRIQSLVSVSGILCQTSVGNPWTCATLGRASLLAPSSVCVYNAQISPILLAKRHVGLWRRPSVCLSVTFVRPRPTRRFELSAYCNIFAASNSSQTTVGQFVLNFLAKIRRDSRRPCKLNIWGYEKLAFFDQYLALFRKQYEIRP